VNLGIVRAGSESLGLVTRVKRTQQRRRFLIKGDIQSDKLPGGTLISAVLDRRLMAWSDRGGASRYFGDRWSEQCAAALDGWIGTMQAIPGAEPFVVESVVRLDSNPEIAIQAGRHQLVNPDFVLYGHRTGGERVVRAADAKFAVDTVKPAQVSAEALKALLAVEGGLVRLAIEQQVSYPLGESIQPEPGVFLSPISPLTDYLLPRVVSGPRAKISPDEIILLPVDPIRMFSGLPMTPLIDPLARIDRLAVKPGEYIVAAMYYFRLACACAWLWVEDQSPLLTLGPPLTPKIADVANEVGRRAPMARTAFELVSNWAVDIEEVVRSRRTLNEVAVMPVRMRELREMIEAAGRSDERGVVRRIRRTLERRYRERLVQNVGEVPARPSRPLNEVLTAVSTTSRRLYPELKALAAELVRDASDSADGSKPRDLDSG
jgi:hypothetical protein